MRGEVLKVSPTLYFEGQAVVTQFYWFCLGGLVSVPQASHWLALPSLRTRSSCESCPALVVSVEANNTLLFVIIDSKLPPACTRRLGSPVNPGSDGLGFPAASPARQSH